MTGHQNTGTCVYTAKKDDPSNWHGDDPDDWILDAEEPVGIDQEEWTCPHEALDDSEYCVFHTDPNDVPDEIDEGDLFVKTVNEISPDHDPKSARRKKEFVGATFGTFDIKGAMVDADDKHPIRLDHVTFTKGILADDAVFIQDVLATQARFETGDETIAGELGEVSFNSTDFGGEIGTSFGSAEFSGDGDVLFDDAEFGVGGGVSFLDAEFSVGGDVSFLGAEFSGDGDVSFDSVRFNGDGEVSFANTEFSGDGGVSFDDAEFSGEEDVSFYRAEFSGDGDVSFSNTEFSGDGEVSFDRTKFSGDGEVSFYRAEFSEDGEVSFYRAEFSGDGDVSFLGAEFSVGGDVSFLGAEFSGDGDVSFFDTEFSGDGDVFFSKTQFSGDGDVSFSDTEFSRDGDVFFSNTQFSGDGDVFFSNTQFSGDGDVSFRSAQFSGDGEVSFYRAEFSRDGEVSFDSAQFSGYGEVSFGFAQFSGDGEVSFDSAQFSGYGEVSFYRAEFSEHSVVFSSVNVTTPLSFASAKFDTDSTVLFSHADFHSTVKFGSFSNKAAVPYVQHSLDFSNTTFHRAPEFQGNTDSNTQNKTLDSGEKRFHLVFAGDIDFTGAVFKNGVDFSATRFPSDADFTNAVLESADFSGVDITGTDDISEVSFDGTNLAGANLSNATLTGASFERARLSRTELLGANLTGTKLYGALLGDARVNRETSFWLDSSTERWKQANGRFTLRVIRGIKNTLGRKQDPYCIHDPRFRGSEGEPDLEKAVEVYGTLETLADQNSLSRLASECFLGRKDVQLRQYWQDGEAGMVIRSVVPNVVARYGESASRVLGSGAFVIAVCGFAYHTFDLIERADPNSSVTLFESLYFSALTFTTLGYGDFTPSNSAGQVLAVAETSLGVILLAILVFVFGRRATR